MPIVLENLRREQPPADWEAVFAEEVKSSERVNGQRVLSVDELIRLDCERYFNIAIADSKARARLASLLCDSGCRPFPILASNSVVLDNNAIGEGLILCQYSMITSNTRIGRFFHANYYSYVAHDCDIGDFVTFAPNVHCNGSIRIENHAYIGAGAVIRQGSRDRLMTIGEGAVIGMGAVVTRSVPPFTTVAGSPARPLRRD